MLFYYKNELYILSVEMRESTFALMQENNPSHTVSIKHLDTKKEIVVKVSELMNYSVVRNRQALRLN